MIVLNYIDDFFIIAKGIKKACKQFETVLKGLLACGLRFGWVNKVYGPAAVQIILGYLVDCPNRTLSLKPGKPEKILTRLETLLRLKKRWPVILLQKVGEIWPGPNYVLAVLGASLPQFITASQSPTT